MKPPTCAICLDPAEALVEFADHVPLPDGMAGHPKGLEWFCARHLAKARSLAALPFDTARRRF